MGTTVRLHRILELLCSIGNVTIISCSNNKPNIIDNPNIKTINLGSWLLSYKSLPLLLKFLPVIAWNILLLCLLLILKIDLLFCVHDLSSYPAIHITSLMKRYKFVFEAHSIISRDNLERGHPIILYFIERKIEETLCKHSDYIIALSRDTFDYYKAYTDNITLNNVFVDTDIFRPLGLKKESKNIQIGIIGPFASDDRRGSYYLDYLAHNIELFDDRIKIVAIGRCDRPILHHKIVYTGFLKTLDDYVTQLSCLDAVIVPEGISSAGPLNKILEPMACALPVFATPKAVIGLYHIKHDETIFIFEENDMVDRINKLIFQKNVINKVGVKARSLIEQYYSKKANYEQLTFIMAEVLHD